MTDLDLGAVADEQTEHALAQRLGPVHLRQRLGIERDKEARERARTFSFLGSDGVSVHLAAIELILRASGTYWRGRANAAKVRVRQNAVRSNQTPPELDGFTILHLSDLHADMSGAAMQRAASLIDGLHYDLCVLTGDYRGRTFGPFSQSLRNMQCLAEALHGDVYGVLGNHDPVHMVPHLERIGIRMLLNESATIERGGRRIFLAGIDDAHYFRTDNMERAATGMRPDAFSILLSHTPENYRQAHHAGFHLMLSGHTHGGQICLPGGIPIVLQSVMPRRLGRGAWNYRGMAGYTSIGAGSCGVPVRFNCPPEVTLHRLGAQPEPA